MAQRDPFDQKGSDAVRRLVEQAAGEQEAEGPRRQRPRYPSEVRRTKATFDLDGETMDKLRDIAQQVTLLKQPSKVAQALLDYALAHYDAGRVTLEVLHEGKTWRLVAVEGDETEEHGD